MRPADQRANRLVQPHVHPALLREWRGLIPALIPDGSILLHYGHRTDGTPTPDRTPNEALHPDHWFREYKPRYPVIAPAGAVTESAGDYETGTVFFRST